MSPTIRHKCKYFHSAVQRAKDRRQKFHFCRLRFDVRPRNGKLNLSNISKLVYCNSTQKTYSAYAGHSITRLVCAISNYVNLRVKLRSRWSNIFSTNNALHLQTERPCEPSTSNCTRPKFSNLHDYDYFKVAQNSFQHIPRLRFWCAIIITLYQLMLQSWYHKNAQSLANTLVLFSWHNRLP